MTDAASINDGPQEPDAKFLDVPLHIISPEDLTALTRMGIKHTTITGIMPIVSAAGFMNAAGIFEPHENGQSWIAFAEPDDIVFWHPGSDRVACLLGRAFALNEECIDNACTYSFDANLNVFSTVSDWLRADRDGIVVLDWLNAFDRLRDAPRIAVAERLLPTYRRYMQPRRLPSLSVIPLKERLAA